MFDTPDSPLITPQDSKPPFIHLARKQQLHVSAADVPDHSVRTRSQPFVHLMAISASEWLVQMDTKMILIARTMAGGLLTNLDLEHTATEWGCLEAARTFQ